jgi:hypothetical protein
MEYWTESAAHDCVCRFSVLNRVQRESLLDRLNRSFPPPVYRRHRACQLAAIANQEESKTVLSGGRQLYPTVIRSADAAGSAADLASYAVVLTAGGDGERLKASLRARGAAGAELENFTKATYSLPGLPAGWGALHANLACLASLCGKNGFQIPVIVTTGPEGSTTARVVPDVVAHNNGFGLSQVRVIAQDERLHLTLDGKIAYKINGDSAEPVTQPDETGGPFVKLAQQGKDGAASVLDWLRSLGYAKIIALQATALYDPAVILAMAAAGKSHDCLGVGIQRSTFDPKDPFGSFIVLQKDQEKSLIIVEQAVRNEETMKLMDETGRFHVPYNTGLYVFDAELLAAHGLPDYATPPKEILPDLPRAPKIGYAATDIVECAKNGAVLTVEPDSYKVIKDSDDLPALSALAGRCGLLDMRG